MIQTPYLSCASDELWTEIRYRWIHCVYICPLTNHNVATDVERHCVWSLPVSSHSLTTNMERHCEWFLPVSSHSLTINTAWTPTLNHWLDVYLMCLWPVPAWQETMCGYKLTPGVCMFHVLILMSILVLNCGVLCASLAGLGIRVMIMIMIIMMMMMMMIKCTDWVCMDRLSLHQPQPEASKYSVDTDAKLRPVV